MRNGGRTGQDLIDGFCKVSLLSSIEKEEICEFVSISINKKPKTNINITKWRILNESSIYIRLLCTSIADQESIAFLACRRIMPLTVKGARHGYGFRLFNNFALTLCFHSSFPIPHDRYLAVEDARFLLAADSTVFTLLPRSRQGELKERQSFRNESCLLRLTHLSIPVSSTTSILVSSLMGKT